jgi:UPF0755 protein
MISKRIGLAFIILLAINVSTIPLIYLTYWRSSFEKTIIIPKNYGTKQIASLLADELLLPMPQLFAILAKSIALYHNLPLQAGEYNFPLGCNVLDIINKFLLGDVVIHKITIPEGYTLHQIIDALEEAHALIGKPDLNKVSEGYLLPETYYYTYETTRDNLLSKMHAAQVRVWQEYYENRSLALDLSQHEILTIASIVEKEAKIKEELPVIAGVYLNRLKIDMPLQADPTIIYAVTKGRNGEGVNIAEQKSILDSPYNTYMYKGLPPTPIANPGKAAIIATLNPNIHDYLYFVADRDSGAHLFASNYKQHLANINKVKILDRNKKK